MRTTLTLLGFIGGVALLSACKATVGSGVFGDGGGGGQGGAHSAGSGSGSGGQGGDGFDFDGGPGTGSGGPSCTSAPGDDSDKDGFTGLAGDCNDCDPNVNPNALEVIAQPQMDGDTPTPVDENCDGQIDNVEPLQRWPEGCRCW